MLENVTAWKSLILDICDKTHLKCLSIKMFWLNFCKFLCAFDSFWECSCFSLASQCCSFSLWQFNFVLTEHSSKIILNHIKLDWIVYLIDSIAQFVCILDKFDKNQKQIQNFTDTFWYICISLLQFSPLTVQFCLPQHLDRDGTGEIMTVNLRINI